MAATKATISILSIGEMGLGIAKLLTANNYTVLTNVTGRSPSTHNRASAASIGLVANDSELVARSDYIFSIVPPRDAVATAERIVNAYASLSTPRSASTPLYYLDLNAISPRTARTIASRFTTSTAAANVRFLDGGIIGPPPKLKDSSATTHTEDIASTWIRPSIPTSGPHALSSAPVSGDDLAALLNTQNVGPEVGTASGLKSCFASLTKGLTALAIQSFSTAASLDVLSELQEHLSIYSPKTLELAKGGLVAMPPKAYRWFDEMKEIGATLEEDGGWEGAEIFRNVAEVYRVVTEETVLGKEKTEERKRGRTVDDVAECLVDGLKERKRRKSGDE